MGSYTITTSSDEDKAIVFTSGNPDTDPQVYLEACVHGQLLEPWTRTYLLASAPVSPIEVGTSYATATPEQQAEIHAILGLTPTPPPSTETPPTDPPAGPTTVVYNYGWHRGPFPVAAGEGRTDTDNWAQATQLGFSKQTSDTMDVSENLLRVGVGTTFHVERSATTYLDATCTGPLVDNGSWVAYPASIAATGSTPTNGAACTVAITIP